MRQLVLLRHAKAAVDSATGEDFDRPLAARGREDAPVVGKALADEGTLKPAVVAEAIAKYGLDTERAAPWTV